MVDIFEPRNGEVNISLPPFNYTKGTVALEVTKVMANASPKLAKLFAHENQDNANLRGGLQSRKKIGRGVEARETNESFDRRAWPWFWFCFSLVEKLARFFFNHNKAELKQTRITFDIQQL